MKRKAYLIASPLIKGEKGYLPGVTPDISNMNSHLTSLHGGAWSSDEIIILENPSLVKLKSTLLEDDSDFIIVQYSGHGFEYSDNGTQLHINSSETISLEEIHKILSPNKGYYFVDCCRGTQERLVKSEARLSMESIAFDSSGNVRAEYRKKFNTLVEKCEKGISIIYSCSIDESADEDKNNLGGVFSYSYFQMANHYAKNNNISSHSIADIFNSAKEFMKISYPLSTQIPTMKPERRINYFPFVI